MILGKYGVSLASLECITPAERMLKNDSVRWSAMDHEANKVAEHLRVEHVSAAVVSLKHKDFWEFMTYLMNKVALSNHRTKSWASSFAVRTSDSPSAVSSPPGRRRSGEGTEIPE
jgi:hypothetical protein